MRPSVSFLLVCAVLVLTGCEHTNDEWAPWANCQNLNLKFGFGQYDQCVEDEKFRLSEEEQREEFKRLDQYHQDQKPVAN